MRIGYMYNMQAFPPKGGNHVHALELIQGFIAAGHSVVVFDDPLMPNVVSIDSQGTNALIDFVRSIDVLYIRIDARPLKDWKDLAKCMGLMKGPVVWEINAPANEQLAFSWLGGRELSACGEPLDSTAQKVKRRLHAARYYPGLWLEESLRRALAKRVNAAICVSSAVGRYAQDLGIDNIFILPNGGPLLSPSDITLRGAKRKNDNFTVFYSGSAIYPWQGLDYLAQVIRLAAIHVPDMRFLLAVNQRSSLTPDLPNVEVREHLDRDAILDAICSADACVAVHPHYSWSKYGFHNSPMKLFEYMACMRPVLTSNHGQMAEIVVDGRDGLLCENNPEKILEKLKWMKDRPDEAALLGKNGWSRIQNEFNWNKVVTQTLHILEQGA